MEYALVSDIDPLTGLVELTSLALGSGSNLGRCCVPLQRLYDAMKYAPVGNEAPNASTVLPSWHTFTLRMLTAFQCSM